jgi:hypothetical protein
VAGEAFAFPVDGGAAHRAEVEGKLVAALGRARPLGVLAGERDLIAGKARLVGDDRAGAALALQAVAQGDARGLAFDREMELPAAAGGTSGGHGLRPWGWDLGGASPRAIRSAAV